MNFKIERRQKALWAPGSRIPEEKSYYQDKVKYWSVLKLLKMICLFHKSTCSGQRNEKRIKNFTTNGKIHTKHYYRVKSSYKPLYNISYIVYSTCNVITRSLFETTLDYQPRILGPKLNNFLIYLVHGLSVIITTLQYKPQ